MSEHGDIASGTLLLLESWFKEFDKNDKVELYIKTDNKNKCLKDISSIKKNIGIIKDFAEIIIDENIQDEISMSNIFKASDCLILPSLRRGIWITCFTGNVLQNSRYNNEFFWYD